MLLALLLALSPLARVGSGLIEDPPVREPSPGAEPHVVYQWTSKAKLRFTWWLPKGYDPGSPHNLTVICHGTGLDYRWGGWNNKPGIFRPDDVVISVDGPTPDGQSRLFMGETRDASAIHGFLGELRSFFAVDRVFLYGHSQGGFFVVYFAGEHPEDVAGVVAHASGAWNWSKTGKDVKRVAIAFMHGTADPVVPYGQSPGSRDHYAEQGFELLHLRRLERYNHWPNAVRANEALAWCQAMSAPAPAEVLAAAELMLRPKGKDEYQYEIAPDFSGARAALRRLVGEGPRPLENVDPVLGEKARSLIAAIESHAAEHVAALEKELPDELELDGKPWLGHLVSLREDFRGVDAVEALAAELGYDALSKKHEKAAAKIFEAWYGKKNDKAIYEAVLTAIGKSFLVEGFPAEMTGRIEKLHKDEDDLKLSKSVLKAWSDYERWKLGWDDGLKQYAQLWRGWKGVGR